MSEGLAKIVVVAVLDAPPVEFVAGSAYLPQIVRTYCTGNDGDREPVRKSVLGYDGLAPCLMEVRQLPASESNTERELHNAPLASRGVLAESRIYLLTGRIEAGGRVLSRELGM